MIASGNLHDHDLPAAGGEAFTELFRRAGTRVERIVSNRAASPPGFWYDAPQAEWVVLLAGSATLEFADAPTRALRPGDWVALAPHVRHRVRDTGADTVWLAVHVD